jgi:IS1 family transposase
LGGVRRKDAGVLQSAIDSAPRAADYYTDGFLMYQDLSYWGNHRMLKDKSETYSVEGGNADIRHYLARLARSSRCFHAVIKHWQEPSSYLFTFTMSDNSRKDGIRNIRHT